MTAEANSPRLVDLGTRLGARRAQILGEWLDQLRTHVDGAERLDESVLLDSAPALLERLEEALHGGTQVDPAHAPGEDARAHAGARVHLPVYDPRLVVREHQLLRDVVLRGLARDIDATPGARERITEFFDAAVRTSVGTFVEMQTELRQHLNSTMAQSLRNTIGVVRMAAELAMDEAEDPLATRSLLTRIRASALRADRLIQDVLDVFVLRTGRRLRLDLNHWDLLALTKLAAAEHFEQTGDRFDVRGRPVFGWWSHSALRRALDNVFENAIRLGDAGVPTTVDVEDRGDGVVVVVQNAGPAGGFDVHAEPGRRLATNLTLARGVAESHGGRLEVTEDPGRGPRFTLVLPRDARPFQP